MLQRQLARIWLDVCRIVCLPMPGIRSGILQSDMLMTSTRMHRQFILRVESWGKINHFPGKCMTRSIPILIIRTYNWHIHFHGTSCCQAQRDIVTRCNVRCCKALDAVRSMYETIGYNHKGDNENQAAIVAKRIKQQQTLQPEKFCKQHIAEQFVHTPGTALSLNQQTWAWPPEHALLCCWLTWLPWVQQKYQTWSDTVHACQNITWQGKGNAACCHTLCQGTSPIYLYCLLSKCITSTFEHDFCIWPLYVCWS